MGFKLGILGDDNVVDPQGKHIKLSPRERSVFSFVAKGYGDPYISNQLSITEVACREYRYQVRKRLGVDTDEEAVLILRNNNKIRI